MCECRPPVATFSAGATTIARIAGPSSGTRICLGLLAVSAALLRASVASAPAARAGRRRRRLIVRGSAIADMVGSFDCVSSRGLAERAGELQVHVVEIGDPRLDLRGA